ncbi:DJ-1/PfpI family protein [bacterium]|nr:MAG: DJ-1/PfpI family protein [bacterium]
MKAMLIKGAVISLLVAGSLFSQENGEIAFVCGPCGCVDDGSFFDHPGLCPSCGMILYASFKEIKNVNRNNHEHQMSTGKTVGILIFPGAEIIDFAAPWEIFLQAGMRVFTVAQNDTLINAMGMRIQPDYTFVNAPHADIILLPGGNVEYDNAGIMNWVKKINGESETILSVCNGAFFLGNAGLLDGLEATTFLSLIPSLQRLAPKARVVSNKRFVDNGKIVTSAGLSSGIDATFHVISKYLGVGRTQVIATNLEYDWDPEPKYIRGMLADKYLQGPRSVFSPFEYRTLSYSGDNVSWETKLHVKTDLSHEKLVQLLEYQLNIGEKWVKTSATKYGSNWHFVADNKKWIGIINYEISSANGQTIQMRVKEF